MGEHPHGNTELTKDTVRLGIIGAGVIGTEHAGIVAGLSGCSLAGISDPNPAARDLAIKLGVGYYTDFVEMIRVEKPDGVIVATPTDLHAQVGIACAELGVHLMVEKPIASTLGAAADLIQYARKKKVHLIVGHHRRFNPLVQAAKDVVQTGKLGRLVAVSMLWTLLKPIDYFDIAWRRKDGAGPVLTNLIHDIDNLRYICGEIEKVYAEEGSTVRGFEVEDTVSVCVRFAGGAVGTLLVSDCVPSKWSYEATTGENPIYFHTRENCYLFFGTEGSLAFPTMELVRYASPAAMGWQHRLASEHIAVPNEKPLVRQIEHFCDVIRGRETPRTSGEDALRSLAVARAVLTSASSGKPMEMKFTNAS